MVKTAKKNETEFVCDRCGNNKFEQKERTDPSDGTKLTNCKKCGYIMLSGGKKIERAGRLPERNSKKVLDAYVATITEG